LRNARLRSIQAQTLASLTRREFTVLGRVAEGETSAEIAAALCIGEYGAEAPRTHLRYEKLRVRNRAAAAAGVCGGEAGISGLERVRALI
jgi:DNA-binding CsgD family transcriptional regulator